MPTLEKRVTRLEKDLEEVKERSFDRFEMLWDYLRGINRKIERQGEEIRELHTRMDRLETKMDQILLLLQK
jgi:chromosome segregation ATPase